MEKRNTVNWFEIPAVDFERAKGFYSKIFQLSEMQEMEMMGGRMAFFPEDGKHNSGSIVLHSEFKPSADGVAIYFDIPNDLSTVLGRVESAGGKVVMPKTKISDEIGHIALFVDSEGNRLGLHSKN